MIKQLQQALYKNKLRRFNSTNLDKVGKGHFQNIRNVGILFNADDKADQSLVKNFCSSLKKSNIEADVLGFFNSKEEREPLSFNYFDLNGVGFSLTPTSDTALQFMQRPFDVLINLDYRNHPPLIYVAASSNALFKVGPATGNSDHYDLMIDLGDKYTTASLLKNIRKTIKLIN